MSRELVHMIRRARGLTKGERKVAMATANLLDGPHGMSWHSKVTIATKCDCDPKTVARNRKRLVDKGVLRIIGPKPINVKEAGEWSGRYLPIYQFDLRTLDRLQPPDYTPALIENDPRPLGGQNLGGHFESPLLGGQNGRFLGGQMSPEYKGQTFPSFDDGGDWVPDCDPHPLNMPTPAPVDPAGIAENGQSQAATHSKQIHTDALSANVVKFRKA